MAEQPTNHARSLAVRGDQPLIGVVLEKDGEQVTYYFADEETADAMLPENVTQAALGVIGAWSHLDWDEMVEALDRIRHDSTPTPPIEQGDALTSNSLTSQAPL